MIAQHILEEVVFVSKLMRKTMLSVLLLCFLAILVTPVANAEEYQPQGDLFSWVSGTNTHPNYLYLENLQDGDLIFGWNLGCLLHLLCQISNKLLCNTTDY